MSDLTVRSAVWVHKVDGVPLVAGIVDGDACSSWCGSFCVEDETDGRSCRCDQPVGPPADLVALRDARCEMCAPEAWVPRKPDLPCGEPRCVDGRPLVDVRVGPELQRWQPRELPGGGYSYRTVKGLVDVVRIDEVYDGFDPSGATALLSSEVDTSSVFAVLAPAHVEALGTIQPGQWAWTFTEVEA